MVKRSKSGFSLLRRALLQVGEIDLHQLELRREVLVIRLVGQPLERAAHFLLELLLAEDILILAPGHGYLIGEPHREARRLIRHRLAREAKVVSALSRLRAPTLEELVLEVYDDVQPHLHAVAMRSLAAHLGKLAAEGRVRAAEGRYSLVQSAASG